MIGGQIMLNKETDGYKNKLKYINNYNKTNCKVVCVQWRKDKDADIIEHLNKQKSKSDYLRQLIRKDMGN